MKNPELVKAFKDAKRRIAQGTAHYICHALVDAHHYGTIERATRVSASELIKDRLGGYYSLEMWLSHKHGIKVDNFKSADRARIRATRVAWLNSLIKEFS